MTCVPASSRAPRRLVALTACFALALLAGSPAAVGAQDVLAKYAFTTTGWATFGLALPAGAARSAVQVGTWPTQTDIKVRWPDGSIRFAAVSVNIVRVGTYSLVSASQPGGALPLTTVPPQASVTLTINGRSLVAALPARLPAEAWLDGPLVSERRAIVAPGGHPFLRVIFDVRSYNTGGHRVDVTVENTLDVAAADSVAYDVIVALDGTNAFQQTGVTHKYLARWRKVFRTAKLHESEFTPDLTTFVAARALPAYLPTVLKSALPVTAARYGILEFGDLTVPMNAHGGRPEIAPYPDWTAQYLVHKGSAARAYMLRHGELAGSWGIHIKEPDGVSMVSIDARPTYWLDSRSVENEFEGPRNRLRGRAEPGDLAHQPSLAFVPYLMTGDRFFADETAYWANFCLIGTFSADHARKRAQGLLAYNEVRGIGWALRNLGDAAAYLPDADPIKQYLVSKVWNNLVDLHRYGSTFQSGPVQTLFPGRRPEDDNQRYAPYMWVSLWEQAYLAWAVDHVMQHGPVTARINFAAAGSAIRDRIARLQLKLFTDPAWPNDPLKQAPYVVAAGKWSGGSRQAVEYFQTLRQVAAATFSPRDAGGPPDFIRPFPGYYGPEARLLLMICQRLGDSGAAAALTSLMNDSHDGVSMTQDLNRRSGWALASDVVSAAPARKVPARNVSPPLTPARGRGGS